MAALDDSRRGATVREWLGDARLTTPRPRTIERQCWCQTSLSERMSSILMGHSKRSWELVGCALDGHVHVGTDAAQIVDDDHPFVRETTSSQRWYRCLRCDGWYVLVKPAEPARERVPSRDEIVLPLRGRMLRDRFVLRLIAFERGIHVIVLASIAVALFLFASHRSSLERSYDSIMNTLLGSTGSSAHLRGLLGHFQRVFLFSPSHVYELGLAACALAALEAVEMIGLWIGKRWAEYLTFIATCLFLPFEIYELTTKVSALKLIVFILNLAVALYLLVAKRLFGLRGGGAAIEARKSSDSGWEAFDRATPLAWTKGLPRRS